MKHTSIRSLLSLHQSLLLPVAHDALTAKLIELAGFIAFSVGGFGVAASAYGKPDNGSIGFNEFYPIISNILQISSLPALVDADTGYGGPEKAAKVVKSYETAGASAIFIEDQVWPKRCGHTSGHKVIPVHEMQKKLRAVKSALSCQETLLMARTDAISAEGSLDAAINRGRAYLQAGADAIFVEALRSIDEIKQVPRALPNTILLVNMMEGGKTPLIPRKTLEQWGYQLIAYPITALMSQTKAIQKSLHQLQAHGTTAGYFHRHLTNFAEFRKIINL